MLPFSADIFPQWLLHLIYLYPSILQCWSLCLPIFISSSSIFTMSITPLHLRFQFRYHSEIPNLTLICLLLLLSIGWPLDVPKSMIDSKLSQPLYFWDPSCFYLRNSLKFQDLKQGFTSLTGASSLLLHLEAHTHCFVIYLLQQLLLNHHSLLGPSASSLLRTHPFPWSPQLYWTHCLYISSWETLSKLFLILSTHCCF